VTDVPTAPDAGLVAQLERSRSLGFLGPGPIDAHLAHTGGFLAAIVGRTGRLLDLGSGGGVPGLIIAVARPDLEVVLVDAVAKRCRFLEDAVLALAIGNRVSVAEGRAEVLGRGPLRGTMDVVVARSFGPPAPTAECAAPFLRQGGVLVVSEPPTGGPRWPGADLDQLGMAVGLRTMTEPHIQVIEQIERCSDVYPRRDGQPAKHPLF
jgi:16S rRNA (guanine527-N7)-methyltransferase